MKRTFQAKPNIKQFLLLAVLLSVVVCLFWIDIPKPLLGALMAFLLTMMTVVISRMICTFYIVYNDGNMELMRGRFKKVRHIKLKDIKRIDKVKRSGTLVIVMNDDSEIYLTPPNNEEEFIKCIEKYRS